MSRQPRPGTCPGLTKTEQLRRAKTAEALRQQERREQSRQQVDPLRVRRRVVRPEPKRVDFQKPGMTKAMLARIKHSEKIVQEHERKHEAVGRVPRRTPAPIGGDARMGRERIQRATSRGPSQRTSPVRLSAVPGPSRVPSPRRAVVASPPPPALPRKTTELARIMNADVVQADPVGAGPVADIVIPAGLVSEERPTIVAITPPRLSPPRSPPTVSPRTPAAGPDAANRSIQVISETLDEQDAAEFEAVQNRLSDLQQARRDFVIAVANVGGNALHGIEDESPPPLYDTPPLLYDTPPPVHDTPPPVHDTPPLAHVTPPMMYDATPPGFRPPLGDLSFLPSRSPPPRRIARPPQVIEPESEIITETEMRAQQRVREAQLEYERALEEAEAARRAAEIETAVPQIPPQEDYDHLYEYPPFDPEELERFFDIGGPWTAPHCEICGAPPPGMETLHPDLWQLQDPWYTHPPEPAIDQPDMPDLIQFDDTDLIRL